jgi:large subunit ribosomal protein L31
MKADIHPEYHEITVVMTDGTEYKTRSTWGEEGDTLKLEVDPKTHPAWTGGPSKATRGGRMDRFQEKFAGFGFAGGEESGSGKSEESEQSKNE